MPLLDDIEIFLQPLKFTLTYLGRMSLGRCGGQFSKAKFQVAMSAQVAAVTHNHVPHLHGSRVQKREDCAYVFSNALLAPVSKLRRQSSEDNLRKARLATKTIFTNPPDRVMLQ